MDTEEDRWLREVVQRLEGSDGLAKIARSTRRADDLRAWCKSLVDAGDWKAALAAFEEAAGHVADKDYARGELLDGVALAAQSLGRKDLSGWLERAWRAGPSMVRLRPLARFDEKQGGLANARSGGVGSVSETSRSTAGVPPCAAG